MNNLHAGIELFISRYKIHVLIFLVALLIALTFSHPSLLVTDEWVTVNQLSQLHDGHQIIVNEGKYGSYEDGTVSIYFTLKNNYLAYPLFLPLISLPAYWLLDLLGESFIFFVLYLWTFILIAIGLLMNGYFREYTFIGKFRWTTGLFIGAFILFFLNLAVYRPFPILGKDSYPEMIAIVFTNIILFGVLAIMVYEICRTIFQDPGFTIFGTVVCISCSSYLFWTNFCKDHALIAFLFTAVVLMIVKFLTGTDYRFLSGAFVITGLLAWARPELALFVFVVLCFFVVYIFFNRKSWLHIKANPVILFTAPFFTLIGAIPFFINNYLFTKNIFVPAWILWKTNSTTTVTGTVAGSVPAPQAPSDTLGSLGSLFMSTVNLQPATFFSDLYGVLFNPQNGSIGILPITPLFLVALFLLPVLWTFENLHMTAAERNTIVAISLLALGVFLTYARGLSGMNASVGIVPDMRYMSPLYLPLNILGLMMIRKIPTISDKSHDLLTGIVVIWFVVVPLSLVLMSWYYPPAEDWGNVFPLLDLFISVTVFILAALFLIFLIASMLYKISMTPAKLSLALLCAVPFIWQIDASYLARLYGVGLGGYSFLVPVIFKLYGFVFYGSVF